MPPGASVLEIGCGGGDLLAALRPADGLGVDVSAGMIELASRHPRPRVRAGLRGAPRRSAGRSTTSCSRPRSLRTTISAALENLRRHAHARTRVIVNFHSQVWRPVIRLAEILRLKARKPLRNWVSPSDIRNVLELAGFEPVTSTRRILLPKRVPVLGTLFNGFVANIWPFNHLCLTYWIVAAAVPRRSCPSPSSAPAGTKRATSGRRSSGCPRRGRS